MHGQILVELDGGAVEVLHEKDLIPAEGVKSARERQTA
jgi:hypothetical protein